MADKQCSMCRKILPITDFGRNNRNKNSLQNYCKSCKRLYDSIWRRKHRKYVNKYARDYYKKQRNKEL